MLLFAADSEILRSVRGLWEHGKPPEETLGAMSSDSGEGGEPVRRLNVPGM